MAESFEIARVAAPPCECGAVEFTGVFSEGSEVACRACGLTYYVADEAERVLTAEGYVRVHSMVRRRLDGEGEPVVLVRFSMGKDDQRPDHDPETGVYRPIHVVQHLYPKGKHDESFYTYLDYCGACRYRWDRSYDWVSCPYCGVTIGNYVFAHGLAHWFPLEVGEQPPKILPDEVVPVVPEP